MSICSVLGLKNDLKHYKVEYLLTSRLNQDCLENLFTQIRGLGHYYEHPLPTEFKYWLRLIILGINLEDIPFFLIKVYM